jgi:hypothetical protein
MEWACALPLHETSRLNQKRVYLFFIPARSVSVHASALYFPPWVYSYVTADGSRIQGSFENGLAHGRGSRRYQNDDEYVPCPQHHQLSLFPPFFGSYFAPAGTQGSSRAASGTARAS